MTRSVGAAGLERIELQRLTERIGQLFSVLQEAAEAQLPATAGAWCPPVDLCETAKAIYVRIELPGVSAAQIKIGLNSSKLRIYGEKKKRQTRQRIVSHLCSERTYGNFNRVVPLRWTISVKDATAELSKGLLVIRLPKIQDRRGSEFEVPITEGESSEQAQE
ncbi:MAG TPA: Hsp20/alpha crystallin family protein [Pyrinomonadaceae bacterium]|nr:Hsp20/alpha crystallin family protein [Pyrinomonadaceae bacterium]